MTSIIALLAITLFGVIGGIATVNSNRVEKGEPVAYSDYGPTCELTDETKEECCCTAASISYDNKVYPFDQEYTADGEYIAHTMICSCDAESFVESWAYYNCYGHHQTKAERAKYGVQYICYEGN